MEELSVLENDKEKFLIRTDADIFQAVDAWCGNTWQHGPISDWDVSTVTNMNGLFQGKLEFNEDLSAWNVSNVQDMTGMFSCAIAFNQNISAWNVGKVTLMSGMFFKALAFNQNLSAWDVGNVTDMSQMFYKAESFSQNLSVWNVGKVVDMSQMFDGARAALPLDAPQVSGEGDGYVGKLRGKCETQFLGTDMFFKWFGKCKEQSLSEYGSYIQEFKPALQVLKGNHYAPWLQIIQLDDESTLSGAIRELVERYPGLYKATDSRGVPCIDLASPGHKLAIMSVFLWFGRYRIVDQNPEHISNTCYVYKAVDELQTLNQEEGNRVALLKLMRYKAHFLCEVSARQDHAFDSLYVMEVLATHPSVEEVVGGPSDALAGHNDVGESLPTTHLTKALAERMYCLVMPWADKNMFVSLKQQRYTGKDMDTVRYIFKQILYCVAHMHEKRVLHADLKPLNIVRQGAVWRVIDLDASNVLGEDMLGLKASTAYVPPEAIFTSLDKSCSPASSSSAIACFKSEANRIHHGVQFDLLHADVSYDVWSLGCVMYQMCTWGVRPLFQGGQDDNLTDLEIDYENNLWILAAWPEEVKQRKLSYVMDPNARHLLSLILQKDPMKRPSLTRILDHPFISLKKPVRMIGDEPTYDLFLSYRVATEFKLAEALYDRFTNAGFRVWWDKKCLQPGQNWKEGFCEGLVSSRTFVCLLSKHGTNYPFSQLTKSSRVDNVFLEHRLALELKQLGLIEGIFPIMIGEVDDIELNTFKKYEYIQQLPTTCVDAVEADVMEYLNMQALGSPIQRGRSVAFVLSEITGHHGNFIVGDYETSLQTIVSTAPRSILGSEVSSSALPLVPSSSLDAHKNRLGGATSVVTDIPTEVLIVDLQHRLDRKEVENAALLSENMALQRRMQEEMEVLQTRIQ